MTVVEVVGASWWLQASRSTLTSRDVRTALARAELSQPVSVTSVMPMRGRTGQQPQQLLALAGVGEGEQNVSAVEQAEVAVEGFGGMEELCRGSRREQGCSDLAGDEAALAYSGQYDAMAALGGCANRAATCSNT